MLGEEQEITPVWQVLKHNVPAVASCHSPIFVKDVVQIYDRAAAGRGRLSCIP